MLVQNRFIRYLQVGGFPELALSQNDLMAHKVMHKDVVDEVLKRDLPLLYNIRRVKCWSIMTPLVNTEFFAVLVRSPFFM